MNRSRPSFSEEKDFFFRLIIIHWVSRLFLVPMLLPFLLQRSLWINDEKSNSRTCNEDPVSTLMYSTNELYEKYFSSRAIPNRKVFYK